uniref:Uncharacterized protein n=1 Tax=Chenopodium quinoa TaxID=63459 RepID=A0A803N4C0_CHEQI
MSKSKLTHHHNHQINPFITFFSLFLLSSSILSSNLPFAFASPSSLSDSNIHRRDPLQHFEFYHGGYNLQSKHYWASAVFTGVHGFAEDTCTALEDFKDNPVNSSLSSLLPCANALKSQTVITVLGQTVHDFITQLNLNMKIMPKELGLDELHYENAFGDRKICDPFAGPPDYKYLAGKCPKHAIPIRELPGILAKFTCDNELSSLESCKGKGKFLPKPTYLMAYAYIRSIEYLTNVYPDLENLIHCSFVKDRISDVVMHQCKPFKFTKVTEEASQSVPSYQDIKNPKGLAKHLNINIH